MYFLLNGEKSLLDNFVKYSIVILQKIWSPMYDRLFNATHPNRQPPKYGMSSRGKFPAVGYVRDIKKTGRPSRDKGNLSVSWRKSLIHIYGNIIVFNEALTNVHTILIKAKYHPLQYCHMILINEMNFESKYINYALITNDFLIFSYKQLRSLISHNLKNGLFLVPSALDPSK